MDAARLSALEKEENNLAKERHTLVLRILQLALADVNHHLQLIQNRNRITQADIVHMQQFHQQIIQLSNTAREQYAELE